MPKYRVKYRSGSEKVIEAPNEKSAREIAMYRGDVMDRNGPKVVSVNNAEPEQKSDQWQAQEHDEDSGWQDLPNGRYATRQQAVERINREKRTEGLGPYRVIQKKG